MYIQHNKHIDENLRRNNDAFNQHWISNHQFVGDTPIPTAELDVD